MLDSFQSRSASPSRATPLSCPRRAPGARQGAKGALPWVAMGALETSVLGAVPMEPAVRIGGDTGEPVVTSRPDSDLRSRVDLSSGSIMTPLQFLKS